MLKDCLPYLGRSYHDIDSTRLVNKLDTGEEVKIDSVSEDRRANPADRL